ncbi:MAG: glutamate racemase [Flavobacteriaceae bacterium]|nr:glutamate racemase [Flavobacteriaceae bacterium]|tara:strand:+ start:1021 stop:1794 length:774 start_codon:yes stop_codon:yes gene_type:complete
MSNNPIGFFDSGIGGITLWKEVHNLLPYENKIYLADSKNLPYGTKSDKEIERISFENSEFLLKKECKLIIVACNTATTKCIDKLRKKFEIPFIGIEPAIKPAALNTKTGKVGVLATEGTLGSNLFYKTSNKHANSVKIIEQSGKGLVKLIEQGKMDGDKIKNLLKKYLQLMINENVDKLVLGCTHYPLIIKAISNILPETIEIIDCNKAVAIQTKKVLETNRIINLNKIESENQFYVNSENSILGKIIDNKFNITKI